MKGTLYNGFVGFYFCTSLLDCFDELNKSDLGYNGLPSYMKGFEAGQQSRQAEIDELRKRLAMYEREGYKFVPVEPTYEMIENAIGYDGHIESIYKAMIGAIE